MFIREGNCRDSSIIVPQIYGKYPYNRDIISNMYKSFIIQKMHLSFFSTQVNTHNTRSYKIILHSDKIFNIRKIFNGKIYCRKYL